MADFNIMDHLRNIGFGGKSDGGGGDGSGEALTPDKLITKGVDKTISTWLTKIIGAPINPNIEGKSATAGFEAENVGSGLSLTNLGFVGIFRDAPGGILSQILKYFTRDLPPNLTGGEGGGGEGGGTASSGGGGDSGGGEFVSAGGHGGGGSFHGHHEHGEGLEQMKVNYGGKMIVTDALVADLGNLSPPQTGAADRTQERDSGMAMG